MYRPLDIENMRASLLTLDDVREKIAPTERLGAYEFETDGADNIQFDYPVGWQAGMTKDTDGYTPTNVTISVNGVERRLTKDAALEAASLFGLQKSYTLAAPGNLITDHINYWYNNTDKALKLLANPELGIAFTRATVTPFSNERLLEAVLEGVQKRYQTDDVLADYKFNHDLNSTKMRLIVPAASRYIQSARHDAADPDQWSVGLEIHNSVIGASALEIRGYGFSWWCTNGESNEHISTGKFRRKPTADEADAYVWAAQSVDDVLGGMEDELEKISHLTQIPLEGELNSTLNQMFKEFDVPTTLRESVIDNLVESDDLSAYGLLSAITSAANTPDLSPANVQALLSAGGQVTGAMASRCESCHQIRH